jgi:hypothetical protein
MILIMYYKYYFYIYVIGQSFKKLTYREARMTSVLGQREYELVCYQPAVYDIANSTTYDLIASSKLTLY